MGLWAGDNWKILASFESNIHWAGFGAAAGALLLKLAYFGVLCIEEMRSDCTDYPCCPGGKWCRALWCCNMFCCNEYDSLDWPKKKTARQPPPVAPAPAPPAPGP